MKLGIFGPRPPGAEAPGYETTPGEPGLMAATAEKPHSWGVVLSPQVHLRVAAWPLEQRHFRMEVEPKNLVFILLPV
ncbi:MAG TPA: hypothetical protein ENK30_00750 [Anaerolineae bacterium]|nr:hypothetical protein [Anaerolineae bacterium]